MEKAKTGGKKFLMGDDRASGKAWLAPKTQVFLYLLWGVLSAVEWCFRPELSKKAAQILEYAKGMAGLPAFLRRRRFPRGSPQHTHATMFPLVKSKCHEDTGRKKCEKPGHSCWRRVLDFSRAPFARGWKVISRAARGVVLAIDPSVEVTELKMTGRTFEEMYKKAARSTTGCCERCGVALYGLSALTLDIDQAFEKCDAKVVVPAWGRVAHRYWEIFGHTSILVRKGKRFFTKIGRAYGRGWLHLEASTVAVAFAAFCALSLCCLGDMVFQFSGVAIGGVLSCTALSVTLVDQEETFIENSALHRRLHFRPPLANKIIWKRYVDDLFVLSYIYCVSCCHFLLINCYTLPLSITGFTEAGCISELEWVDLLLKISGDRALPMIKNKNRQAILDTTLEIADSNFVAWPGKLHMPFKTLRGVLVSRLARSAALRLSVELQAIYILETLLELHLLSYPAALLRKLSHSLPCVEAARRARLTLRLWLKMGRNKNARDRSPRRPWDKKGGGGDNRDDRSRDAGKRFDHRWRRRSASPSSSSSESSAERKLMRAKKFVEKKDPIYAKALKEQKETEAEQSAQVQAKILADAIAGRLGEITASALGTRRGDGGAAFPSGPPTPPPQTGGITLGQSPPPMHMMPQSPVGFQWVLQPNNDQGEYVASHAGGFAGSSGSNPFPPPPPPLQVAGRKRQEGEKGRDPTSEADSGKENVNEKLDKFRLRWLEAEFAHKISFKNGSEEEFVKQIKDNWTVVVGKQVDALFKTLGFTGKNPRGKDDKLKMLHAEVLKN